MLIGIDASRANKQIRTGTEWYSFYVIEELKKIAQNVSPLPNPPHQGEGKEKAGGETTKFILYSREPLDGELAKLPANFESRVLRWPPKYLWTQIRLNCEMFINPPDVLFVPAHTIPIFGRTKKIVTIHDVGFRAYPELYSWVDLVYHRFSAWYACRFAYKIITISQFTKSELIKYYNTDPHKIFVTPLGVNLPHPQPLSEIGEGGPGPGEVRDEGKNQLLFIGRIEKKKNILGILRAFKIAREKLPDLLLVLAGLPGHGFDEIKKYIAENNLSGSVTIKGYITEEEKNRLYANSLAFIFPSFYEGFGLPILEAQASGCPVVTSNRGACAEVARKSALLVNPYDPQDISAAILKLQQKSVRDDLVKLGYANSALYSWKNCAKMTYGVIKARQE